jgi:hypothetical protein
VDLFEPGTGFSVQVHDYNPGIAPSGLFWTVPIPDDALSFRGRTARLELEDFPVVDSRVFLGTTEEPARVTLDVTFTGEGKVHEFRSGSSDPADPTAFAGRFRFGRARGRFSGGNASGLRFRSSVATSDGLFAEIGHERNGVFLGSHGTHPMASALEREEEPSAVATAPGLGLARALPNPAIAASSFEFTLGAPAPVSIAVFDPAGRRVATILDGRELPAGAHAYRWDLRDASGRRVAPGIYLVEWKTPGESRLRRLAVLP